MESFAEMLAAGGKSNSLGRAGEVVEKVLHDNSRLDELYNCLFDDDAWVRMRAADSLEKVCRARPDWLLAYIDRFSTEVATSTQPSIQWHLAQMYAEVTLTASQKRFAISWLKRLLSSSQTDWIVAANSMGTLAQFVREGAVPASELVTLLKTQQQHRSKSVVKRADRLLTEFA